MPKVERVYNLRIDIVTKRKKLYQLKMLFNKLTNVFVSFRDGIDPQILYKMLLLYILWLEERRQAIKGYPGRNFQNDCFTVTLTPLGSKAASTLVPYRLQTVTPKRKGLQQEHWTEPLRCTVKKTSQKIPLGFFLFKLIVK